MNITPELRELGMAQLKHQLKIKINKLADMLNELHWRAESYNSDQFGQVVNLIEALQKIIKYLEIDNQFMGGEK
jgi:hypothetical protein